MLYQETKKKTKRKVRQSVVFFSKIGNASYEQVQTLAEAEGLLDLKAKSFCRINLSFSTIIVKLC